MQKTSGSVARALPTVLNGGAATAVPASADGDYVNYVDVKLMGVHHLPADWLSAGAPPSSSSGGNPGSAPSGGAGAGGGANNTSNHSPGGRDEEEAEVAFAFHPFRYEVTLALPTEPTAATETPATAAEHIADNDLSGPTALSIQSPSMHDVTALSSAAATGVDGAAASPPSASTTAVVAAFTRGRVLQSLPAYTAYIANAEAVPVSGLDDASPLRDVPAAIDAEDLRRAGDSVRDEADGQRDATASPSASAAATAGQMQPAILWVVTDKTDNISGGISNNNSVNGASSPTAGLVAAKRRLKTSMSANAAAAGGGASAAVATTAATASAAAAAANTAAQIAAAAAVPGAPPPLLPDASEPAPCVVRVPLTAAQEAYVDALLNAGAPLELRLRRTLRAGCPPEWEDLNAAYYEAVIPVSLAALSVPGSTHLSAQVPLEPALLYKNGRTNSLGSGGAAAVADGAPPGGAAGGADHQDRNNANNNKKRAVTRKARQTVPGLLVDEPDRGAPHPYALAGTTADVSLTFQRTLTRLVSDRIRPAVTPAQLIPARPMPSPTAAVAGDVRVQLQSALRDIAQHLVLDVRDLANTDATTAPPPSSTRQDTSCPSGAGSAVWRAQFVTALQSTGQLAAFKTRLTPLVTALVQERLRVHPAASAEEVAAASNELYVQLMDMLHVTLHETVEANRRADGVKAKERGASPQPFGYAATAEEEASESDALRSRALEAEVTGEHELAGTLLQSRLATHTGSASSWASLWMDCALHYQRTEELARAEQCYREAIACDVACVPALLDYGVWLLAHDRLDEAAVFLHGLVDVAPRHLLGWGGVGLLADLRELAVRAGSPDEATQHARWRREHRLALRRAVDCLLTDDGAEKKDGAASADPSEELVYVRLAAHLIQLHHRDLANVCLARCRPGEPQVELLYAQLFVQGGQHAEALKALDEARRAAATMTPAEADTAVLLRAECAAALGRSAEAITLNKQALAQGSPAVAPAYLPALAARWRGDVSERRTTTAATSAALAAARDTEALCMHRLSAYVRLCNALLAEGRYQDALGAVTVAMQVWPGCAVLWLGAGIAYYRAGDMVAAEECLQEGNTLDPSNPRTWAFLALLSVRLQHAGVDEIVQQAMALNLDDAALWAELGRTLLNTALYPELSVLCLRRAAALARAPTRGRKDDAAASLLSSTLYHLAHALMDMQQWAEAERLLSEVATGGGSNEVLRGKAEEELSMLQAS